MESFWDEMEGGMRYGGVNLAKPSDYSAEPTFSASWQAVPRADGSQPAARDSRLTLHVQRGDAGFGDLRIFRRFHA